MLGHPGTVGDGLIRRRVSFAKAGRRDASRRCGRTRTSAGQLGGCRCHARASRHRTTDAGCCSTDNDGRAGCTDSGTRHRTRAELRRTGHEACGDARAEDAQRQQRE